MFNKLFLLIAFIFSINIATFSQNDSMNDIKVYLDRFKKSKIISEEQYQTILPLAQGQIKTPSELFTHICRVTFHDIFKQHIVEYNQKAKKKDRIPENISLGMTGMKFPVGMNEDFERLKKYTESIYTTGAL